MENGLAVVMCVGRKQDRHGGVEECVVGGTALTHHHWIDARTKKSIDNYAHLWTDGQFTILRMRDIRSYSLSSTKNNHRCQDDTVLDPASVVGMVRLVVLHMVRDRGSLFHNEPFV